MAKKSFKGNNPALQFITTEEETIDKAPGEEKTNTQDTQGTQEPQHTQKKADLKGKRFNLLFYSTDTLENLKKLSIMNKAESVNALINDILNAYAEEHKDQIETYNTIFKG